MTAVVLEHAEVALWSDVAGTRIVLERLQVAQPSFSFDQVFVAVEGQREPVGWRGEHEERSWQMTARFLTGEHARAAELVALFRRAHRDDSDGRILLRTNFGEDAGLNDIEAVLVSEFAPVPGPAGVVDVQWSARAVGFTLGV